jgi:hypothetical protein
VLRRGRRRRDRRAAHRAGPGRGRPHAHRRRVGPVRRLAIAAAHREHPELQGDAASSATTATREPLGAAAAAIGDHLALGAGRYLVPLGEHRTTSIDRRVATFTTADRSARSPPPRAAHRRVAWLLLGDVGDVQRGELGDHLRARGRTQSGARRWRQIMT